MHSFKTPRLLIRPLEASIEDKEMFLALYTTPKIMRFIGPTLDKETAQKTFNTALKKNTRRNQRLNTWTIVKREDSTPIGIQFLFKRENQQINTAEIGVMLLASAHGKQIPEEAMRYLLDYAYYERELFKVYACFASKNLATLRFVSKIGFVADDEPFTGQDSDTTGYFEKNERLKLIL